MIPVAKISDIPECAAKTVSLSGQEILLVKSKGTIFACENECPHQGASLAAAIVRDGFIVCPRHGYRFSLVDGQCPDHPAFILKIFPVQITGDEIYIDPA